MRSINYLKIKIRMYYRLIVIVFYETVSSTKFRDLTKHVGVNRSIRSNIASAITLGLGSTVCSLEIYLQQD